MVESESFGTNLIGSKLFPLYSRGRTDIYTRKIASRSLNSEIKSINLSHLWLRSILSNYMLYNNRKKEHILITITINIIYFYVVV